jgi:ubiquinone/menaquinone biosynthesis C-methylase UbiE
MNNNSQIIGWGIRNDEGAEIWDSEPVFKNDQVFFKDWCKLLFYPKKWFLYRYINRALSQTNDKSNLAILDVGCGMGATLIDFKRLFGRKVRVVGVDVVKLQVDLAKEKIKKNAVWAEVEWYDGEHLPFEDASFDAIYTSDVLGHVRNVPVWLNELNRVLKPGGVLAMFTESKLGKHAYVRNYLMKRGLNVDPHAEFHISLYSKSELKKLLGYAGFKIKSMRTAFWASFLVHPDEMYNMLNVETCHGTSLRHRFLILRLINKILYWVKKKTMPYSMALCEFYGLVEMYLVGKWVEAQGYIVLAKKDLDGEEWL